MSPQIQGDAQLATQVKSPDLSDLFIQFLIIGAVSFGGGIIAYERILLVEKRKWLSPDEFMAYLAISQTMPGLNSVNLAVLAGDHLRRVLGAIMATLGLILPGSLFVLGVGIIYASSADHPSINLILGGISAAVTYQIGDTHWRHMKSLIIIVCTFVLMSILKLSLPYVILIMAPISIYLYRPSKS